MIVDDKPTFEQWFIDDKFASENVTISIDSKVYIDDLLKKPDVILKIETLPELPVSPILNFKQTLSPVVNTLDEIISMDTKPNKDALKKEENKFDTIMDTLNENVTETKTIDDLISPETETFQRHLGLTLDIKLNFSEHIKSITKKISKTMGLLRKFQQILPGSTLLTIYKTFIRSRLGYADIVYDQACNSAFHDKLESIQYSACLAITGAIRGISTEKIYQELGLESLKSRRWFRKLCHFYKIDLNIRNSASLNAFKKKLLNFIWPCSNSIFDIHNPLGIKLLTRLRLGLSPLHEHKFRHCIQDTLNPLCECAKDIESTMHFFLHCTNFLIPRQTLFQKIRNIDNNILCQSETQLTQTLLYGSQNYHPSINRLIINSTIEYIISTERFKCSLFN